MNFMSYLLGLATLPALFILAVWVTEASPWRAAREVWSWSDRSGHRYRPWDRTWIRMARVVGRELGNQQLLSLIGKAGEARRVQRLARARWVARWCPWLPVVLWPPALGRGFIMAVFGPRALSWWTGQNYR